MQYTNTLFSISNLPSWLLLTVTSLYVCSHWYSFVVITSYLPRKPFMTRRVMIVKWTCTRKSFTHLCLSQHNSQNVEKNTLQGMSGYIYKMEYYSFLKENETLSFWSSIMLSETSQTQRQIPHVFIHICGNQDISCKEEWTEVMWSPEPEWDAEHSVIIVPGSSLAQ